MLGLPARVAPRDLSASIIDVKVSPTDGQSSREFHIGEGQRVSVAIAWKDAVGVAEGDAIHYQLPKQLDIGDPLTFEIPDRALNRVIAQGVIDANNHLSITFNKEIAGQTSSGSVTVNAAVLQPDSGPVTFDLGRFGQVLIHVDPKSQEMSDLAFQRSYFSGLEESWLPDAEKTGTEKPGDDLPITDTFSEDPFKDVTGPNEGQTETPQDPEDTPLKPVGDPPEDEDDEEYLLPIFTEGKPFPLAPQKKEPQAPAEVKVEKSLQYLTWTYRG
ncbi:Ig-like domain-containing protein [Corynebacterium pseudotuberculosis]|nr:Ig-like domain-containing protein [Corynebacterium pseudotuberculosis]AEX40263.1 Hypothetical protein Cp3995_1812 [Corynebacterium pseudotuberculosis 3/99-5]AIG05973.1 hypothetical protein CPTA_00144 [Corynebacterium pseudotuberculosis]AIG11342.1 hypothetical protein CPTC_01054 [Corynebacterium pseudotuberculosis]